MLVVSACTGQVAIETYCDIHVQAMEMYAKKYGIDYIQVKPSGHSCSFASLIPIKNILYFSTAADSRRFRSRAVKSLD